jgi:hypothetical protein
MNTDLRAPVRGTRAKGAAPNFDAVQPVELQTMTAIRVAAPLAGLMLVGALLSGCAAEPAPSGQPTPTGQPMPSGPPISVYYIGQTPAGPRLFREFEPDADPASDRGSLAVRELLTRPVGNDPDYRSAWPPGWAAAAPVGHADGVITVDLRPPPGAPGPSEPKLATLGIQQLVYSVQDALTSTDPVRILLNGQPADLLWGAPIRAPIARAEPTATRALVQIDQPGQGAVFTSSTVRVRGDAAAFEATVLWQVLRGSTVVAHGHATASEAFSFSPYEFSVRLAPGRYTVRVYESDESDGEGRPPFADTKDITVLAGGK